MVDYREVGKMKEFSNTQKRLCPKIQNRMNWKRVSSRRTVERTSRGYNIIRKYMMKKYPWYFTIHSLHSERLTKKGTKLKLKTKGGKCMCKYCGFLNK